MQNLSTSQLEAWEDKQLTQYDIDESKKNSKEYYKVEELGEDYQFPNIG